MLDTRKPLQFMIGRALLQAVTLPPETTLKDREHG